MNTPQKLFIVTTGLCLLTLLLKLMFGSKSTPPSPPAHPPAGGGGTNHGHGHQPDANAGADEHHHSDHSDPPKKWWKKVWSWIWLIFGIITVAAICDAIMKAPPTPTKVWGPTEVLYTLEVHKPNGERSRMSNPNTIITIQTEANFECWFPTQDGGFSKDCKRCVMSQKFTEGETTYGEWSGEYDGGTHKGKFLIFKNTHDYIANKRRIIRGHFWDEGQDPLKDPPYTFTLYPTEPTDNGHVPIERTVDFWL
jgi:hypothetical protein